MNAKSSLDASPTTGRISRAALSSFYIATTAGLLGLLASFGSRWGWWHFRIGFIMLLAVVLGALVALVLSVIGLISSRPGGSRRGARWAILGLLMSLVVLALPVKLVVDGLTLPPINDITTDTENPPSFIALLPHRQNADNPAEYRGAEVAAQQRQAYPKVRPELLTVPPAQAFERAHKAAKDMGWEIVEANPNDGRIEAIATTFWFGFKDDVVVRISPANEGSRIDVRSVSRVGTSDVGVNASRIEEYLSRVRKN